MAKFYMMLKILFTIAVLLVSQSVNAQALTETSSSPCELLIEAIETYTNWAKDVAKVGGSKKLNIANHGFDLTCLTKHKDVQLFTKEELTMVKNYISIFAIRESEKGIEVQMVRTTNGINQAMEYVVLNNNN